MHALVRVFRRDVARLKRTTGRSLVSNCRSLNCVPASTRTKKREGLEMNKNLVLRGLSMTALVAAFASVMLAAHARPAAAEEGFEDKSAGYHQCVIAAMRGTRSVTAV